TTLSRRNIYFSIIPTYYQSDIKMKNYIMKIFITSLTISMIFEIISFLLFQGLFANLNYYCGSACEIWPGISISEVCVLMCVPRNGYYFLFFIIGTVLITGSIISLVTLQIFAEFLFDY
ncbi:MAG: hypothetical protein ACTSR5_12870, partial [Promethearchaeota archaeon]